MTSIFRIFRPLILCCPLLMAGVVPGFAADNSDTASSAGGAAGAAMATPDLITASQMGDSSVAGLIDSLGGPYAPIVANPRPFIAEFAPATKAEPDAGQTADGGITERWSNGWVSPADRLDASVSAAPR
ncbi:MAG: hypothetical protein PW790_08595 [Parvibaculaceae bacterium]|nr:hypothetical protein [Parvibaculaceae bacterium]